jgi:hypothetical protein
MIDLSRLRKGTYRISRREKASSCSIPAKYGTITPLFGDYLLLAVTGHPRVVNRLLSIPYVRVAVEDGDSVALSFPAWCFDDVAEVVRPRRKRVISEEHKSKLRAGLARYRARKATNSRALLEES